MKERDKTERDERAAQRETEKEKAEAKKEEALKEAEKERVEFHYPEYKVYKEL